MRPYTKLNLLKHKVKTILYEALVKLQFSFFLEQSEESFRQRLRSAVLECLQKQNSYLGEVPIGILHIGANTGQEAHEYHSLGLRVLWIEGDHEAFEGLKERISSFHNQSAKRAFLDSQERTRLLHRTSDNLASTSFFPPSFEHMRNNKLEIQEKLLVQTCRLDNLLTPEEVSKYPYWVIDVQGAESDVLQGSEKFLGMCKILEIEVSGRETYVGGTQVSDLVSYLAKHGFQPLSEIPKMFHGNIIFLRVQEPYIDI